MTEEDDSSSPLAKIHPNEDAITSWSDTVPRIAWSGEEDEDDNGDEDDFDDIDFDDDGMDDDEENEDLFVDDDGEPVRIDKAFSWEYPLSVHGLMHNVITNAWRGDPYPIDTLMIFMARPATYFLCREPPFCFLRFSMNFMAWEWLPPWAVRACS